jgi:transposase-like protein
VFTLTRKIVKVEIECPSCESNLRIRPRPGKRELTCPGCQSSFFVTF